MKKTTPSISVWRVLLLTLMMILGQSWSYGQATQPAGGAAGTGPGGSSASSSAGAGGASLAIRQERVQRMMSDLEEKLIRLAKNLETTEPERSRRLVEAIQQSRQTMIENRMATIVRLLSQEKLDPAGKEQGRIMDDLKKLVELLMKDDQDKLREQIRQLEKWSQQLHQLTQEEIRQRDQSLKMAEKDRVLSEMQKQIQALGQLVQRQQQLNQQTDQARQKGAQELPPLADKQKDLRQDTEQLAKDMENLLPSMIPSESQSPSESTPSKPSPSSPSESTPSKPSPSSPSESTPSKPSPSSPSESTPGKQPMDKAIEHQKSAQEDLGQAKGKSASEQQDKALENLKKALGELEKEKQRVAEMSPDKFPAMAKQQDDTAQKTDQLAKEMGKAASGSSESSPNGESSPSPGQEDVEQANQQMQQASGQLQKQNSKSAAGKQQEAVKKLQKAKEKVDKKLAQLRQEAQEEVIAELEARFRRILLRQQPISQTTIKIDQTPQAQWDRAIKLQCSRQAVEQEGVAQMVQEAQDILREDGSTVVFVRIVAQLHDDTLTAHQWLKQERTGAYTQQLHRDIERTIQEILDALKQAQEQGPQPPPPPPGEGNPSNQPQPPPPLVPNSAELKLLKAAQLRVNNRTVQFDKQRPAELDPTLKQEVGRIANWQEQVRQMTQDLAERK